jgi:3-oxoacyl-[acyl-carrier protein] reductase
MSQPEAPSSLAAAGLNGKVALVTGASRGIGRAIAWELASQGAAIVVNYRESAAEADSLCKRIESDLSGRALPVQADVSRAEDVERLVAAATERFERVDILVNNAGITRDKLIMRMTDDDWGAVLQTNLSAAFLCTRACLRGMIRQRWGRIVNISSVSGIAGNAGQANYAAAKAGLVGLTRSIAREVASRSITANVVAPGFITTEIWSTVSDEAKERFLGSVPLARAGEPEEVAALVAFIASERAGYITGQVISIDGGLVMA